MTTNNRQQATTFCLKTAISQSISLHCVSKCSGKHLSTKKGFTLAEVLITLGIIGVVAAMTIPTLMNATQSRETVTSLKKVFSTLSSAYLLAQQENGPPETWDLTAHPENMLGYMAPYLKVTKNCGTGPGCFPSGVNYKGLDGSPWSDLSSNTSIYKLQLPDGMIIAGVPYSGDCTANGGTSTQLNNALCGGFDVDINGFKGPNTGGKDVFAFYLTKYGIIPCGTQSDTSQAFSATCLAGLGEGCTAWVIYNENTDYTKSCKSTLSWSGPISCN